MKGNRQDNRLITEMSYKQLSFHKRSESKPNLPKHVEISQIPQAPFASSAQDYLSKRSQNEGIKRGLLKCISHLFAVLTNTQHDKMPSEG